jgi:DNA-binding SARP family transcriptional activator/ABC-type transport system substrate-binding protein
VEFRLLGPLEVRRDGEQLALGGPKQRALLSILLLHANEVVPRGRLLAEVWGERAPDSEHSLDVHLSRLRKILSPGGGDHEVLIRRGGGYLLRVGQGSLDLVRFEEQTEAGERALAEGRPAEAARLLNQGLGLWRGEPLAEFAGRDFADAEAVRLKERRLAALGARIDADLALGREAAITGELESLVDANPFRERFCAQLMLALYRAGRQGEALAVYTETRKLLIDELGIEPGEELRALQRGILAQDQALLPAKSSQLRSAPADVAGVAQPGPPRRPGRRRWALVSVAGLLGVAVAVASALIPGNQNPAAGPGMIRPGSVAFIDARSGRLVGDVPVGPSVGFVRSGLGSVWEMEGGVLLQINPRTHQLTRSIAVDVSPGDVAIGEGAVWVTDMNSQTLLRINPRYGQITRIRLPSSGLSRPGVGGGVAVGAGSVWVAQGLSRIARINPASSRVEATIPVADANVVAFGEGAVWVAASDLGTLTRIDPRTGTVVTAARIGPWICCLTVGGGYLWAANNTGVWKLAPDGKVLNTYPVPSQIANIYYGDQALWAAADAAGTIMRIDPHTGLTRAYRVGHLLTGIAVQGRTVAVSVHSTGSDLLAHLSGPVLQVRNDDWFAATDPAVAAAPGTADQPWEQQLQYATCAPLLGYPDAPAPGGWRLVPEAATAWPAVSPDGRTYTFKIRPGLRFSPPSGQPVTAATFKYTIERALSPVLGPDAPALSVASDIAGFPAYQAGSSQHISGIRATQDTLAITLMRPAADFPERIALSYFCPVPIGTPIVANGLPDPIPSAGPYYLSGNLGGTLAVLRRNPSYHGPRPHRLAAIVYREQPQTSEAVAGIEAGHADYVAEPDPALASRTALARHFSQPAAGQPRRYFATPLLATDELAFDTRHGPFADPRLRRAASYALDRPALAAALGDLATGNYLPPGMPGSRYRQVYPVSGPDLQRARALAGTRAGRAILAVCGEPGCIEAGQIIRADLARIGVHIQLRPHPGTISTMTTRRGADIVLARVFAPYPDPAAFLKTALGGRFAHNRLDKLTRLDRRQRLAAAGQLELQLMRGPAPVAAIGTPAIPEFFSARVSCHIFQPLQYGTDLATLCLR